MRMSINVSFKAVLIASVVALAVVGAVTPVEARAAAATAERRPRRRRTYMGGGGMLGGGPVLGGGSMLGGFSKGAFTGKGSPEAAALFIAPAAVRSARPQRHAAGSTDHPAPVWRTPQL